MPELDYMVLADYVRIDAGIAHIMGAGIDTIKAARVPAAHPMHLAVRLGFGPEEEPGATHSLKLVFGSNDQVLTTAAGSLVVPQRAEGVPEHWKTGSLLNFQITLPLPEYGDYTIELVLDEEPIKSIDLRVIPRTQPGAARIMPAETPQHG